MFDPHRTRRSDRRYYTRKGQVIQANRVDTQPVIAQRLVPVYKDYLFKNNLAYPSPPAPPPPPSIYPYTITSVKIGTGTFPISSFTVTQNTAGAIDYNVPTFHSLIIIAPGDGGVYIQNLATPSQPAGGDIFKVLFPYGIPPEVYTLDIDLTTTTSNAPFYLIGISNTGTEEEIITIPSVMLYGTPDNGSYITPTFVPSAVCHL